MLLLACGGVRGRGRETAFMKVSVSGRRAPGGWRGARPRRSVLPASPLLESLDEAARGASTLPSLFHSKLLAFRANDKARGAHPRLWCLALLAHCTRC